MNPLTALDIAGIKTTHASEWVHRHACPSCGNGAWSGSFASQCIDSSCPSQVMAPLDIVARQFGGDYMAADLHAARIIRQQPNPISAMRRQTQRRVMDYWIACCQTSPTTQASNIGRAVSKSGMAIGLSHFSTTTLDSQQIDGLIKLATETGADLPESWTKEPPGPCVAYCVQSTPHTIDRIVFVRKGETDIIWNRYKAGFSGLIGLWPERPKLLAADALAAMRIQAVLERMGRYEEVASVFTDPWRNPVESPWRSDIHLLTAVTDGVADVIKIQTALDNFPTVEKTTQAIELSALSRLSEATCTWGGMRIGHICQSLSLSAHSVTPAAAQLFELTGSRLSDAAAIIDILREDGHLALADDFQKLTENRIIHQEPQTTVRETANEYQLTTTRGTSQIANFTLRLRDSVRFRDRSDTFCRAVLRCGKVVMNVVLRHSSVGGKASKLQEELHNHLVTPGRALSMAQIPTIVDASAFQKYISRNLTKQLADLPMVEGISRVGWSSDRKTFHAPGVTVGEDGRTRVSSIFYPGVATLRSFVDVPEWAAAAPSNLHPVCQDLISLMLAQTVRYYKRYPAKPVCVMQSSDSVAVLEGLMRAMGQSEIFDMGANIRDVANVDGVNGYPLVASGYGRSHMHKANISYIVLTDEGYQVTAGPDPDQIEAAGRALQFALMRVVEWCLATGADEFAEAASMEYHTALMREGQWLVRNVCDLQPWEISVQGMRGMEGLFSQIPAAETRKRMTLINGEVLTVDTAGMEWDRELVFEEVRKLGAEATMDGDKLVASAAVVLPPIAGYYGKEPDVTLVEA